MAERASPSGWGTPASCRWALANHTPSPCLKSTGCRASRDRLLRVAATEYPSSPDTLSRRGRRGFAPRFGRKPHSLEFAQLKPAPGLASQPDNAYRSDKTDVHAWNLAPVLTAVLRPAGPLGWFHCRIDCRRRVAGAKAVVKGLSLERKFDALLVETPRRSRFG
jgi:hypothetical protein